MKAQAKKMNVDSLKSGNDQGAESAEMKIAKVGFFSNSFLFVNCIRILNLEY